jgi:hypothetical protein
MLMCDPEVMLRADVQSLSDADRLQMVEIIIVALKTAI